MSDVHPRLFIKGVATSLVLLLLLGLGMELLLKQYDRRQHDQGQQRLLAHAYELRAVLLAELNATLHLATGLASYIPAKQGQVDDAELQPWLRGLFQQGRYIRNIGLAPGNRIDFIYPLAGNEAALGLYYPNQAAQWPAIERTIASRSPSLVGPLALVQGGRGLIYRVPVYLNDQTYWGLISTVIDFDRLSAEVEAIARTRAIAISLQPVDQQALSPASDTVALAVSLAGAQWRLEVSPITPVAKSLAWLRVLGWALVLTLAGLSGLAVHIQQRRSSLTLALKRSQREFLQAFELAPQGMVLLEADGRLLVVNHAFCKLLQLAPAQLLHRPLEAICPPAERASLAAQLAAVRPGQNSSWFLTLLDAQQLPVAVECSAAILGTTGAPGEVRILHVQDMRERLRLQRLQSEFTASVSHELRTPLTAIAGALGLVNGGVVGEVPPAMQQLLQIAYANSVRLQGLINDLLDIEKLLAGKVRVELREQTLWPLLQEAVAHNQPYADQHQVTLQLLGPPCDARVVVDEQRLAQVLANLLSNAAKFSPSGTVVTVSVREQGDQVRVNVHDQGVGIDDEFRTRIFSKFSQADASDRRQKGGTGLGLAISKELIEHMHGCIGFDSTKDQGTTFWFELPFITTPTQSAKS